MATASNSSRSADTKDIRASITRLGLIVALVTFLIVTAGYFAAYLTGNLMQPAGGWFAAGTIAVVLVIDAVIIHFNARKCAKPIEDLSEQANRFAGGDFSVEFKVEDAPAEEMALADSLNAITRSTRTAVAELKTEGQRQRQFVSDVSHEIRTPLASIRGSAETLLDDDMPVDFRHHFLETIMNECDRLTRLANDLLELSRIEADRKIDLSRIDLKSLVEKTVDMMGPLLTERGMKVTIGGEAPDVLGDHDMLTQVLVNLLENASRFAKGEIHIELSGLAGKSLVTVTDDGPGFGDTDPSRLFDRFYRGDKSRATATGGTGLGLAIVKSIVESHDGTVEAFNVPNGGACFAVALPAIPPQ